MLVLHVQIGTSQHDRVVPETTSTTKYSISVDHPLGENTDTAESICRVNDDH